MACEIHKITEWLNLEGTLKVIMWSNPMLKQGHPEMMTMCRRLLNLFKEGDPTTSLGNLCRGSVTLPVKKCFLILRQDLLCSVCACCLWSYHWVALKRAWLCYLYPLPSGNYVHWSDAAHPRHLLEYFLLQTKQSWLSQPLLVWETLIIFFMALCWIPSIMSASLSCWGVQNCTQYSTFGLTSAE